MPVNLASADLMLLASCEKSDMTKAEDRNG